MADDSCPSSPTDKQPVLFKPSDPRYPLTVEWVEGRVRMHSVPEDVLESLATGGIFSSLCLAFFGICFGVFVTCASTVYSRAVTDPTKLAVYTMLTASFLVLTLFFFIGTAISVVKQYKKLQEMKRRPSLGR